MSRIILLVHLSSFLVAHFFISGVVSTTFTITNSCNYTVWPGVSSAGASALFTTGFSLEKNESTIIIAPASWNGRFWGRTYCTEDSSGNFSCITGDCGSGKLECSGSGGAPPATLAEFGLGGSSGLDFYDVSLVDGFNLPLLVVPSDPNCSSTGCFGDVNECKSARDALRLSISNTTYTCPSTDYQITFCPGVVSTTFTITNNCNYTVWPGVSSSGASALSTTGFSLEKNESKILKAPASWNGRFWGRTNCTEDSSGNFSCITGDCGSGKLECSGSGGAPPATMAEFALEISSGFDFYDVSLVDGFNLPLLVVPSDQNCSSTGCFGDVNKCKSARDALRLSISNTTYTCPSTDYQITFCPGGTANNSRPSSGEITPPSSMPDIRPNATSRRRWEKIIAGVVGGVLAIISFVVIVVLRVRWSKSEDTEEDEEDDHIQQVPGMPVMFSYRDLCIATDDFKEEIGSGGFGSVFKGVLADRTVIAVKRLDNLSQGKREFLAEVETIGSVHHFNLVRLIGFCAEKSNRLLVYEYMSNGSLDSWIFEKHRRSSLDWKTRKKIIIDIAKGLAYLHEECRQTIIHLDIKPQNILLDPKFNAKISDFGLSKLIDREMSKVQLSMRGTPGYLAPEWHKVLGHVTIKVDVYSFGIVLLEVVCARRNVDHSQPESAFHLLRMLQNKAEYILGYLDEYIQSDREEIIRMLEVAAWCLQDDPERRPLMSTVVKVLEGLMEVGSNLVYKFSHALTPPLAVDAHISSAPPPSSVLSNPR